MLKQAAIPVEREAEFGELKTAVERVFSARKVEEFLKRLDRDKVRVRHLAAVLDKGLIERVDEEFGKSGNSAKALYQSLTVSDQGQMREFYLSKVEEVEPALRAKFQKLYRYY